jgi:hypothetical protein
MFNKFEKKIISQNGEDGIIEEIIKRLNLETLWCCEFGAWDGMHLSNTFHLVRIKQAKVIMIEGDEGKFLELLVTAEKYPTEIFPIKAYVDRNLESINSLDNLLKKTQIPQDFDILSIDIDSYDLDVWESVTFYKPKLVIIEINNDIPPGVLQRHSEQHWLNSFTSTVEVGTKKGYTLVCHSFNLFFIRNDLIEKLDLDPTIISEPDKLFNWKWVERAKKAAFKQERRRWKLEKQQLQ